MNLKFFFALFLALGIQQAQAQFLVSKSVALRIKSNPSQDTVEVDGEIKGTTPIDVQLTPGKHSIRVYKGQASKTDSYTFGENTTKIITVDLTPLIKAIQAEKEKKNLLARQGSATIKGKTYKTIRIGNQTWMAENLNYNISSSSCYNNNSTNCNTYGRLYTWNAAKQADADIAGWHLPTDAEWDVLAEALGGKKDTDGDYPNMAGQLIEGGSSGFKVLYGGYKGAEGRFNNRGSIAYFWSASPSGSNTAWYRIINRDVASLHRNYYFYTSSRFSVRLLKD